MNKFGGKLLCFIVIVSTSRVETNIIDLTLRKVEVDFFVLMPIDHGLIFFAFVGGPRPW